MISETYTGPIYEPDAAQASTKVTGAASGQGQDAFLKMFMAQMTNQNPLNPMDNTEFTAQLAQFSSLEQLTKIAAAMEGIGRMEAAFKEGQMVDYIGKEVTISGNQIPVTGGQAGGVRFNLAGSAEVRALVTDETGRVVADEDLGRLSSGPHDFRWDGKDLAGQTVPNGKYSVSFVANDAQGNPVGVSDLQVSGLVTGYTKDTDGKFYLMMGDVTIPFEDVLTVGIYIPADDDTADGENDDGENDDPA